MDVQQTVSNACCTKAESNGPHMQSTAVKKLDVSSRNNGMNPGCNWFIMKEYDRERESSKATQSPIRNLRLQHVTS